MGTIGIVALFSQFGCSFSVNALNIPVRCLSCSVNVVRGSVPRQLGDREGHPSLFSVASSACDVSVVLTDRCGAERIEHMEPETKPNIEGGQPETIHLIVKDQHGAEVTFKVKMSTKFEKIMHAYATKKSIEATTVRFMFEGQRLLATSTPQSAGMADHDVIDCVLEQIGGGSFSC